MTDLDLDLEAGLAALEGPPTILAAGTWATNADLITDAVVPMGYLGPDDVTLDPTWGMGKWWTRFRPKVLIGSDLDARKSPTGTSVDARRLPWPDNTFDVIALDMPYTAPGGRKTSTIDQFNDNYGLHTTPASPAALQAMIHEAMACCHHKLKPGGRMLVKAMDYTSSGNLWEGSTMVRNFALDVLGMRVETRYLHVHPEPGMQPKVNPDGSPRRQVRPRNNFSTLWVLVKGRH